MKAGLIAVILTCAFATYLCAREEPMKAYARVAKSLREGTKLSVFVAALKPIAPTRARATEVYGQQVIYYALEGGYAVVATFTVASMPEDTVLVGEPKIVRYEGKVGRNGIAWEQLDSR